MIRLLEKDGTWGGAQIEQHEEEMLTLLIMDSEKGNNNE